MSQDTFITILWAEYKALDAADRKEKIRELAAESEETKQFLRQEFPDFFAEAFPEAVVRRPSEGRTSVLNAHPALCAKPH